MYLSFYVFVCTIYTKASCMRKPKTDSGGHSARFILTTERVCDVMRYGDVNTINVNLHQLDCRL